MESKKDKYRGRKKSFFPVIIFVAILLIAGGFYLNSSMTEENATSKSANRKEKPAEKIKENQSQNLNQVYN